MTKEEKLIKLLEWGAKFSAEKDLDKLLLILADSAKELLEADRCSIFIADRKKNELWTKVAHEVDKIVVPLNSGIVGYVARTGETVKINEAYSDPRFNPEVDRRTGYKTRNIIATAMRNQKGEIIGVFEVINKDGKFTLEDEEILAILSSHAAVAIENALLYDELKKSQLETVLKLSIAAEYRDPDTYRHLVRISKYSELIAKAMKLPEEKAEIIKLASPMHDIGKLGVPDSILLKPGKLSDEEWERMKKHTEYGYRILEGSNNEILKVAANVALTHHERYDGRGYPRGLERDNIPLEGRIVALADVFDALTSKRVYKDKIPVENTLEIIKGGKGKQFDPEVVDAFFKVLDKILKIVEEYAD